MYVHLTGDYPYNQNKGVDHAVVAHGFYGTRPLWYTVSSIIADYGWHTGDYGAVEVNKEYIYSFGNFNIF